MRSIALLAMLSFMLQCEVAVSNELRSKRMVWHDFEKYPEKKYDMPVKILIEGFGKKGITVIQDSLTDLECRTCLDFEYIKKQPRRKKQQFIHMKRIKNFKDDGTLGFTDGNLIKIGDIQRGTIVHEVLHALGADHTMTRPDRDQYLKIKKPDSQEAIIKDGKTFGLPYEYESIMHYDDDKRYKIIKGTKKEKKEIRKVMGFAKGPTANDVRMIQMAYCDGSLETTIDPSNEICVKAAATINEDATESQNKGWGSKYSAEAGSGSDNDDQFTETTEETTTYEPDTTTDSFSDTTDTEATTNTDATSYTGATNTGSTSDWLTSEDTFNGDKVSHGTVTGSSKLESLFDPQIPDSTNKPAGKTESENEKIQTKMSESNSTGVEILLSQSKILQALRESRSSKDKFKKLMWKYLKSWSNFFGLGN